MNKPSSVSASITVPKGFLAAGGTCGIKPSGKPDLALIVAEHPCSAAGVFTTNRMPGAPVVVSRRRVRSGRAMAIVCNSGVSNVCTGEAGIADARAMAQQVARRVGGAMRASDVLPASTGVIGRRLPMDRIISGIDALVPQLARGVEADQAAATAILTTDLRPKSAIRQMTLGGRAVCLAGIAKGSGMIAPNMATMLVFLTTDVACPPQLLRQLLKQVVGRTFNRISVDHDTSTSDMVLVLASGDAGNSMLSEGSAETACFAEALEGLCGDLAEQVITDGEGVTRVFEVEVIGAKHQADAEKVGHTVTGSPLVKTAIHGADPNWGRLVMAVGRSGASIKPERLGLSIAGIEVCRGGLPVDLDTPTRSRLEQAMRSDRVVLRLELGMGDATTRWLGCDLSREYIAINADYTT